MPKLDPGLVRVLKAALFTKAAVFITVVLGFFFFSFNAANYRANFIYPAGEEPGFAAHFKTWDAQHYLFLAEQGYQTGQESNAFYPLFPFLIKVFRLLFLGNSLLAGLFLSNLFSITAMVFLYSWFQRKFGRESGMFSCFLILAFPTAFFLDLAYAESLFLALAAGLFYCLEEKKPMGATFCAFLLPLAKPTGLLVLLPALAALFLNRRRPSKRLDWERFAVPLAFGLGFGFYLGLMRCLTGDSWSAFHAQRFFASGYGIGNLWHPLDWFMANFIKGPFSWMGFGTGLLDRIFFILFLAAVVLGYRKMDRASLVYSLVLGLIPALSGDLASFCRYWIVLFPLFGAVAYRFQAQVWVFLALSFPLQGALALLHSLNFWVG